VSAPRSGKASAAARELARRRLRAQHLSTTTLTRPADVVAWLGAVQAQDYAGGLWAIGLRLVDARQRDVERAIEERAIVRSWPMRGTLHFLAAQDARWMIDLLAPKAATAARGRLRALGIDEAVTRRARRVIVEHLEGGRRLTRPEAYRQLERARIPTGDQRGLHLLWRLAHDGLICLGPRQGKQQTVVLLEEWLPRSKVLPRDVALAELARRYFTGHGPATDRDFAWWSGLTLTEARRAIASTAKLLEEETIDGQRYWFSAVAAGPARREAREEACALPPFDEYLVGYADRSAALAAAGAARPSPFEILGPVVIIDGQLVAKWKRTLSVGRVTFTTTPFFPISKARAAAVTRALAPYARFLEA
jgi:hypothetical protein